jgi:Tfp pilus assembly protein PilN
MNYSLTLVRATGYAYTLFIILFIVGFFQTTPSAFITFTFVVKVLMALFLLYRFNPFSNRRIHYTILDQEIILASALFILISSFTDYINQFLKEAQKIVSHIL